MRIVPILIGVSIGIVSIAFRGPGQRSDEGTTTISSDGHSVVLTRAPNGHFYTTAMVNGHPVHFMIDTGATTVALSREDAEKAGIVATDEKFTETGQAASGEVRLMPVMLDSVDIGNLEVPRVEGVVIDGDARDSLLGQSWLSRLDSVRIEKDRMTLR